MKPASDSCAKIQYPFGLCFFAAHFSGTSKNTSVISIGSFVVNYMLRWVVCILLWSNFIHHLQIEQLYRISLLNRTVLPLAIQKHMLAEAGKKQGLKIFADS